MEPERELEELISQADPAINALIDAYEPYESSYLAATAVSEMPIQASNTSSVPRSLTVSASSAR
jgi:hypothetical protein